MSALLACGRPGGVGTPEHRVAGASVVVSTESEVLGRPVDIALDSGNNLYILDYHLAQILVLSPAGALLRAIGQEGSGPREFVRPRVMALSPDTVRVVDVGNGRLQTLALESNYLRTTQLPAGSNLGPMAINDAGRLLMGTFGLQNALAAYYDESGDQVGTLGSPFESASSTVMDFESMKKEIIDGRIPPMMRNSVLPVFGSDGGMWLVLNGEALVQRYDSQGVLQMSAPLAAPELALIKAEVVARNVAFLGNQRKLAALAYVSDGAMVGQTLLLLLNMPDDHPAVMLTVGADGAVEGRVHFTNVIGARQFTLDPARTRVLFTIPSRASIVAAPWPVAALGDGAH